MSYTMVIQSKIIIKKIINNKTKHFKNVKKKTKKNVVTIILKQLEIKMIIQNTVQSFRTQHSTFQQMHS